MVACAIAVATTSVRTALTPALGPHSLLLPALAAVLAAVVVSGRGPGRVAIALCSIITAMAVYPWSTPTELAQCLGHVVLFISLGGFMTEVVHSLQLLHRRQLASMRVAQEAESHAKAAAAQLLLIADSVPVLIAYVDSQQRYRFNNRQYEEWFGFAAKDLHGKHVREVLGNVAYDTLMPRMLQALDGRAVHFESAVPHRTGGTRHVSVHYVPDMDAESKVCGFFALIEDVSEASHRLRAATCVPDSVACAARRPRRIF
jgi:PAS domain S-box-containing protein